MFLNLGKVGRFVKCFKLSSMKKNVLFIFLFSIILFIAKSQDSTKAILWKISGNGLSNPSYLYGVMHLVKPLDFIFNETAKSQLQNSDILYTEINLKTPCFAMDHKLMLPDMANIKTYLTRQQSKKLWHFLRDTIRIGHDKAQVLFLFRPFVIYDAIYYSNKMFVSFEMQLYKIAKESNVEIQGIEPSCRTLYPVDSINLDDEINELRKLLDNNFLTKINLLNGYERMVKLYNDQDIKRVYELSLHESESIRNYNEVMLKYRSKSWISPIRESMKTKKLFIAVGVAHLYGENGLIELFKKEGYSVIPVN